MRWGMLYKGSKNKLTAKIFELFPQKKNFYDLFCGGCAMAHFALANKNYNKVVINDVNQMCTDLFFDAINGKFKDEKRWISREDFLKSDEPYVKVCWSFGNNMRDYLYSKEIEPYKKALHYARVFNDFSLFEEMDIHLKDYSRIECNKNKKLIKEKYIAWYLKNNTDCKKENLQAIEKAIDKPRQEIIQGLERLENFERLQSLENFERLQSLQSLQNLENLERLQSYNLSFENVPLCQDSILYCDIPYKNTDGYTEEEFDFEKFYLWCEKQTEPVFVSSYEMPEDRFACIASFKHRSILCATANNEVVEKVFIPIHQVKDYHLPGSLFNFDKM